MPSEKAAQPSAGRLGRRRALPNGRAVAGGFAIAAAAVLVFGAWLSTSAHGARKWVVARSELAVGTRLLPGDLATEAMGLPSSGVGAQAFSSPGSLVGRVLRAPLDAGELVQSGDLVPTGGPPPLRPVVASVPSFQVAGLSPGSIVDLLVSRGSASKGRVDVVLRGATVLRLASSSGSVLASSGTTVVTLGVPTLTDVEAVVQAQATGKLTVVAGERSDGVGLGPPASPSSAVSSGAASAAAGKP